MTRTYHRDGSIPDGGVWVFGSNLAGRHGAGAARVAVERFGARYGQGIGAAGRSYAIPTKDERLEVLPIETIREHVERFLEHARAHPEERFFVTRVGCGLAGFADREIAPLFRGAPGNCSFAEAWRPFLEDAG